MNTSVWYHLSAKLSAKVRVASRVVRLESILAPMSTVKQISILGRNRNYSEGSCRRCKTCKLLFAWARDSRQGNNNCRKWAFYATLL